MTWTFLPEPVRSEWFGDRVLVLGLNGSDDALVIKEDGLYEIAPLGELRAELRFSWKDHRWHDVAAEEEALYDAKTNDGRSPVSGSVSESDGASDGDPRSQEHGDTWDVDAGEAGDAVAGGSGLAR